jgi:hypothetical protein
MELQMFAEFLIRNSNGKITQHEINIIYFKLESFAKGYVGLGEMLVKENFITHEELRFFLEAFEKYKKEPNSFSGIIHGN